MQYVPDDIKTKEIVIAAIENNGCALRYVPSNLMTEDIVKTALLGDCSRFNHGNPISCVPKELLLMDLLIRAVEHFPFYLGSIPTKRITKRLAEIAVSQNGLSLRFIPGKYITPELASAATAQNAMAIRYVPQEYITAEMCKDCFDRNCAVLPFLPAKFITKEMCLQTIEKHRFFVTEMLDYRKEEVFGTKDVDLVEFKDFPEKLRNDRDILDAIIQIYVYGSVPLLDWNEKLVKDVLKDAEVCCTTGAEEGFSSAKTDSAGRAVLYLNNGRHMILVKREGYPETKGFVTVKGADRMYFVTMGENSGKFISLCREAAEEIAGEKEYTGTPDEYNRVTTPDGVWYAKWASGQYRPCFGRKREFVRMKQTPF